MNLDEILKRIDARLEAVGLSADTASKLAGKKDAIRNIRRAAKERTGRKGVSTATLAALAPVLETSLGWLVSGEVGEAGNFVPIVGYVGAGGLIEPVPAYMPRSVEVSFPLPNGITALVAGDMMRPQYYEGDVIFVRPGHGRALASFRNQEALVRLKDGSQWLRTIAPATSGRGVNLITYTASDIENVEVDSVSEIYRPVPRIEARDRAAKPSQERSHARR